MSTSAQSTIVAPALNYADNVGGLKQLAADIHKAQQKADSARAQQLLESFVLPNSRSWYSENFTTPAVAKVVPSYEANASKLPARPAGVFLEAYQEGFRGVDAVRYEDEQSACSSPQVFGAMIYRRTRVPLYELRFTHGDKFKRVFAFAYVDGAFRLVLVPDFSSSKGSAPENSAKSDSHAAVADRVRLGGAVVAAQLVCRVQPYYPQEARMQYVSGTVRLHTIIGKDGSVKQLELVSGPAPLVPAATAAVSQWRYRPTMINGEPVEVDTTIDIIFSLH